ncbi:chaoptin, partial [Eurytemora carolleeae]|uniref:chaoptin n=1 Tax=Eurytemora carolleeae TaxID=1294199 RepID=UPI000C778507
LSGNRIERIEDTFSKKRMRLDRMNLANNRILTLEKNEFSNFAWLNFTSLQGNPLHTIQDYAFSESEIRHLDLQNCQIGNILPAAFRGLERSLQELNLASNRLSILPYNVFEDFDSIRKIDLSDNVLAISPNYTFSEFRYALLDLDLSGDLMRHVPSREIGLLRNLRHLSLPSLHSYGNLRLSQFEDFPPGLEEISLVNSDIKVIRNNAFYHVPSVSSLDLSGNKIQRIEEIAFKEIGNSLRSLRMRHALHLTELPNQPFQNLVSLILLDLSDNHLVSIPLDTLHKMKNLRELYLQDNKLTGFMRGTLHSQANPELRILDLSFNHIRRIEHDMFRFEKLETLLINDNRIQTIESRAFVEMRALKHLNLEGNQIVSLNDESFQNLHSLQILNLAYNNLRSVNFDSLDYVGSLSPTLHLDLSHNNIPTLASNQSQRFSSNSRIRSLDISYNNITSIQPGFFETMSSSLRTINIAYNKIPRVNKETIGSLRKLVVMDLSNNLIDSIEENTLEPITNLQRLNLANNNLGSIKDKTFRMQRSLQVLDLSGNQLQELPEHIFQVCRLEIFKISSNLLMEIPVKALNPVQSTLRHLDLSRNNISLISESQLSQIRSLVVLDLSNNRIKEIDSRAFCCLPELVSLSLSHNPLQMFSDELLDGVGTQLEHLDLSNTSLSLLPNLNLPELISLNMSLNKLTFVPSSSLANMSNIRELDLSWNSMPSPPHNVWYILPYLASLSLSYNPMTSIKNESFLSLDRLQRLDLGGLELTNVESGSFATLPNLKHLTISVNQDKLENLGDLLHSNPALEVLHIHSNGASLKNHLSSSSPDSGLPDKLKHIIITSETITNLHPAVFKGLQSRELSLTLISDKILVERDLFLNLGRAQNLTLNLAGRVGNRSKVSAVLENPASSYTLGAPYSVFLEGLNLGDKLYPCNCDSMGWLGKWLRRWRGEMCGQHYMDLDQGECWSIIRDLRQARCMDSDGLLLDSLKKMDCLSFNTSPSIMVSTYLTVILALNSFLS